MRKKLITGTVSALAIAGAAAWIYYQQYRAPKINVPLYHHVGEVMADQVAKLAGKKQAKVVVITLPPRDFPELDAEYAAFTKKLGQLGDFKIHEDLVDTKDQPKYGLGMGLSGRHFVRTVKKREDYDVIVSFIGAPKLDDEQVKELAKMPKFLVQARAPDHLYKLFEKKLVHAAVISRFTFPAPGPLSPKTPEEWFEKRFQVFAADNASTIPKGDKAE